MSDGSASGRRCLSVHGRSASQAQTCILVQARATHTSAARTRTMDDLTIEPAVAERPERSRPVVGVPSAPQPRAADGPSEIDDAAPPSMKPGSIGVRYRLKRRFRTYEAIACVPAYLAQTPACDTILGADGDRILDGQTYEPVLIGGARVAATDENLDAIIRAMVPREIVTADHPAVAERMILESMRPALDRYLLIDGQVWVSI